MSIQEPNVRIPAPQQSAAHPGYVLDADLERGFLNSVHNNQTNLALQYLVLINEQYRADLEDLRAQVLTTSQNSVSQVEGADVVAPPMTEKSSTTTRVSRKNESK